MHRREMLHPDVRLVAPEPQPLEVAERHVCLAILCLQIEAHHIPEAHNALRGHHARVIREPVLEAWIAEKQAIILRLHR